MLVLVCCVMVLVCCVLCDGTSGVVLCVGTMYHVGSQFKHHFTFIFDRGSSNITIVTITVQARDN